MSALDLVPASRVSRAWRRAVSYSLSSPSRLVPWLLLHLQSRLEPSSSVITHAYDPNSHAWVRIPHVSAAPSRTLRSCHPGLLHNLSPTKLAFSTDPFGSTWRELDPPRVCRGDAAVVALVGPHLVVAGGAWDFEGEPCAVETCAAGGGGGWETCEPMPDAFRDSASTTWLSVAASERELYVLEKRAGQLCSFDPAAKRWGRTRQLRPDPAVFLSAIGLAGGRLILVGAAGDATNVESIRLWEVDLDTLDLKEIGRMPREMVGRLVGDGWGLSSSIGFSVVGRFGYLYNPSDMRDIFLCEFGDDSCRWAGVGSPAAVLEQNPMHSIVSGCSVVGINDLETVAGVLLRPEAA